MTSSLPERIRNRTKRGFNAPVSTWMQTWNATNIWDRVTAVLPAVRPEWSRLTRSHAARTADEGLRLWDLFIFDQWLARPGNAKLAAARFA
jgi:Asparagine synthase